MQNRIWQEQCAATRQVRRRYGTTAAFDYLVGEKLLHHVSAAAKHPEFSAQLPMFIAEIRRIFDPGVFARDCQNLRQSWRNVRGVTQNLMMVYPAVHKSNLRH